MRVQSSFRGWVAAGVVGLAVLAWLSPGTFGTESASSKPVPAREPGRRGQGQSQGRNQGSRQVSNRGPDAGLSIILGRPTDRSIALSVLSASPVDARMEYGFQAGEYTATTDVQSFAMGVPREFELAPLRANTRYHYRLLSRAPGSGEFRVDTQGTFHTWRPPTSAFTFTVQGDSHPERMGRMYHSDLYALTLRNVARDLPDFHVMMGDDFSVEPLVGRGQLNQAAVNALYAHQRSLVGLVGRWSPLFLVNGNHEQAARYLLDGTDTNPAVLSGRARTGYFPLPAPDSFYAGNAEAVEHVGLPRDYYAWIWGDALFVVIDFYWHTPVSVDNAIGGRGGDGGGDKRGRSRDLWDITLGEAQYRWLERTLLVSPARWKFVFCHHVLGTGRGGVEMAGLYEWGGRDRRGVSEFPERRPGWALPIHDLLVKAGVTIFFQGHDHLYARQELDGVVYQSCPNPADPTYQAFNRDAYRSGDIRPNSGHLRVTVAPERVRVDYVRSFLPADEAGDQRNGTEAASYTIAAEREGTTQ